MKRSLVFLAFALSGFPLFAEDPRVAKQHLIRELLGVIDTKELTQSMFNVFFARFIEQDSFEVMSDLTAEERKEYELIKKREEEQTRLFRERLYARIDYAKFADEVYAPLFDKSFTTPELKELIVFYKTPAGRKTVELLPELALGSVLRGTAFLQEVASDVERELANEESARNPWKRTMADLRTVATATEAYATDANRYPDVKSYKELQPILSPTYIRKLPEQDAWGTPFSYIASADGRHYRFASAGADMRFDWNAQQIETLPEGFQGRAMESLDDDIIFQDGTFVQFPVQAKKDLDQ